MSSELQTGTPSHGRETFASKFGALMTMIGVAVGLGAVWRFPYMVGKFGGAAFVMFYMAVVFFIGIPALMAEWALGRFTRRGTLGAFEQGGLPAGRWVGRFLFVVVLFATGYYSNALGWVGYHAVGELVSAFGGRLDAAAILPPPEGFNPTSFALQLMMTALVIFSCGIVLVKGLRNGIEKASKWIVPALFASLIILIVRSVTLEGARQGIEWYIGGFRFDALTPSVMAASLGMAFFSMSLGGTFMVIYGSYLDEEADIPVNAVLTGVGASVAGLLAGFAIFPAVFSFGLEPSSGPSLIFSTLPKTFSMMPAGWVFGLLFYLGLFGAAYLSDVAALEVLVGGVVDNTQVGRTQAVVILCWVCYALAIPPMVNFKVFVPWDLTFGSGMQVIGSFLAVVTVVWFVRRAEALKELSRQNPLWYLPFLYWWLRLVIPAAILFIGINWLLESVFDIQFLG